MDGTLLTKSNGISPKTLKVIQEMTRQGIHVFLATGRHLDITIPYHRKLALKTPIICLNGAGVYDWFSLDPLQLRTIQASEKLHTALVRKQPRNMMIHTAEGLYCSVEDEIIKEWTKEGSRRPHYVGSLDGTIPADILKYSFRSHQHVEIPKHLYHKNCSFIRWNDGFELVRRQVSKWSAIEYLLNQYGISRHHAIAFGDGPNDIEMIQQCGIGVAMGNAITPLKAVADFVTGDHEADGLADFIQEFMLNGKIHPGGKIKPVVI